MNLTPEDEQWIVDRYLAGDTVRRIRERVGLGEHKTYDVLHKHGVVGQRETHRRGKFTPEQEAEITRRYVAGEMMTSVANEFDCCVLTVRNIAVRNGAKVRKLGDQWRRLWSEAERDEIHAMWLAGNSQMAIAKHFQTSQPQISRILKDREPPEALTKQRRALRAKHGQWKGGRTVTPDGYVRVMVEKDDPMAAMRDRMGYALEHRLVMARAIGRPLQRHETVHHVNGDPGDNRLENLQLRQGRHGKGVVMSCADCGSHNIQAVPIAD